MSELQAGATAHSFFDRYSRGEASPDDIEDDIARWHETYKDQASYPPLHEFLGLTHDEYEVWLSDPFALPCILRARLSGNDLIEIMVERYEELRTANRTTDGTIVFSLGNWLKVHSRH